jgi:hypothetical protein
MPYFAQINETGLVLQVIFSGQEYELTGEQIYSEVLGGIWKRTSYNTRGGVHIEGGIPFRKNYAGIGYYYDSQRDAFIPPSPFPSWVLNEDTCLWNPPIPYPDDDGVWKWNEELKKWTL